MSGEYSVDYAAIREVREQARKQKVREITSSFLERYANTLADMQDQNLDKYVKSEYNSLVNMLAEANGSLTEDPDHAREISLAIGQRIHGLPRLARELRREINASQEAERREEERRARERQIQEEKERQAAMRAEEKAALEYIDKTVQTTFADPVEQDIVRKEFKALKKNFESQVVGSGNIKEVLASFDRELSILHKSAQGKAEAWREKKRNESLVEDVSERISMVEDVIQKHTKPEISSELAVYSVSLSTLREDFRSGIVTAAEVVKKVVETENAATNVITTEAIRREVLKDILKTTQSLGFIMNGKPILLSDGNVKLNMRRPGGENCTFLIDVKGGLQYNFDGYQGKACRKDIESMKRTLDEVYGIHLSNERVIWENPDEIGKSTVNNPDSIGGSHL